MRCLTVDTTYLDRVRRRGECQAETARCCVAANEELHYSDKYEEDAPIQPTDLCHLVHAVALVSLPLSAAGSSLAFSMSERKPTLKNFFAISEQAIRLNIPKTKRKCLSAAKMRVQWLAHLYRLAQAHKDEEIQREIVEFCAKNRQTLGEIPERIYDRISH